MSWTLCTSGAAIFDAGKNANANIVSYIGAYKTALDDWSDRVESVICDICRVNVVTSYSGLTSGGKQILNELASSMIAEKMVKYDIYSYNSKAEANLILNVLENSIRRCIPLVEDDKVKKYMAATTG